ncbi:isoleucine--tRNA ligase [Aestuariimicrobium sp. p3-SID1156]|uniref:isoleucine--tRNA ligase n=1 Tax=Aestuariimicrobium sp. p3-SID1156 TaxID=2916038 RepID=UPI00223BD480|nr:isoleucine--tRNA ligase [Aestuariimicrobium sp. p3-SID1156]MCT1458242.1 isoleucine--tRNA ligase [Aestuariimicrobium sp. p3-SID1156]
MTTQPPASAPSGYRAVPAQVSLPDVDHEVLELWASQKTFERSLEQTRDAEPWTFYEGPPTANGQPGTHHVEARVFKDVFPRFKTMQGFRVDRKAGWDCHGLPVELAVEKELGFNGKPDIEAYGIEAFNARCRESVTRHVGAFAELTTRMGYWVNMDQAYWTMDPNYVQAVWWALKQVFDKGLLVEDYRVAPYCPRCGTTLSDHELAQGYEDVVDPSVYVRMPLTSGPLAGTASLLVWTTTPWTLVSNTAVAAHPDVTYVAVTNGTETLVVAEPLVEQALAPTKVEKGEDAPQWQVVERFTGAQMENWTYQRPFDFVEFPDAQPARPETGTRSHFIVLADYVTTEDGTGLVHQSPAFGADDMAVCRRYGLPMVNPVRPDGTFEESVPLVGGHFFKSADPLLVADLKARGILFHKLDYEHSYPHCWRCHTALLYYAQPSWYIRTTQIKDALLRENENTTWFPENIKHGRYGDWLENNIDWALSRNRYWGTPLPIWRNDLDPAQMVCVGSLAELSELAGRDLSALDPHRPFVDDITFTREGVEGTFRRVPEVIDAWFDSGSMPFAQWGYPLAEGSVEAFQRAYPADFICEAIDQTRGWFYTLMAIGTLVFDQSSYKTVLCLGHILAEDGRKMSKHLGNILLPIPLMDKHGADAVRWFMAASGSPWSARRVGDTALQEVVRKVMLTYWNTVSFQALYARANSWTPAELRAPTHVLDRWLTSTTQQLVLDVTSALEAFDTQAAGQLLAEFIDNLSNWYVRRSRRRFWEGDPGALSTLHTTLVTLTQLMAPMAPFVTERVWQDLVVATDSDAPESVHLSRWPVPDESLVDADLAQAMAVTRRLVELGRSARAESRMKTRQRLARILVPSQAYSRLDESLLAELRQELNVMEVGSFASAGDLVDYTAKGNFRALGKRFGKKTPLVAGAIAKAGAAALAAALAEHGRATIDFDGGTEVTAEEVILSERPREGWSVVNEQGETVALDLELTPELVAAGLAREVVRFVQDARKSSGLEVSDRITLEWAAEGELADAIEANEETITEDVLATSMFRLESTGEGWFEDPDLGLAIRIAKA